MTIERVLVLVGSPKPGRSTSLTLAEALTAPMAEAGVQVDVMTAHKAIRTASLRQKFFDALDSADLLVIAFPVYIDAIPAPLTQAMEMTVAQRGASDAARPLPVFFISNCGFPEPEHTELSLAMCEQFSIEAGLTSLGGVGIGEGGVIHGQPLEVASTGASHRIIKALREIGDVLLAGDDVSDEQIDLVQRPMIPLRFYTLLGTIGWLRQARSYRVRGEMWRQPYGMN